VNADVDVPELRARTLRFGDGATTVDAAEVRLAGRFNLDNAEAAAVVCLARGIDPEAVRTALRDFPGVPHRFETVAEIDGVRYVNDSKATNPSAAAAALRSFEGGVHAILGGSRKGGSFDGLPVDSVCTAYLIGEAAEAIAGALAGTGVEVVRSGDLERAVAEASRRAQPGDTVLLAPACASFDQYRDYEERGEHFRALVRALAEERR
jgi:UDP-N-acetylmuramoylalanine--D-glutamate ligase